VAGDDAKALIAVSDACLISPPDGHRPSRPSGGGAGVAHIIGTTGLAKSITRNWTWRRAARS